MNTETATTAYAPTYWNGNGRYQEAFDALRKIVSANFIDENGRAVEVPSKGKSRYLAKFQKACWAYYDLFNNHLYNERQLFTKTFGFSVPQAVMRNDFSKVRKDLKLAQQGFFFKMTDDKMDMIILNACAEQSIHIK